MSQQMAAVVGYLLDEAFTDPAIAELRLTLDGGVLAVPVTAADEHGAPTFLGAAADLRANLSRLGMASGLDDLEWDTFARLVREQVGLELSDAERTR
jgi:hypothetical protein